MSEATVSPRVDPVTSVVSWVNVLGVAHETSLAEAARVDFEEAAPVRGFPSYRGQRNFPGFFFAACMGRHVGFESWLERDEAMAMDFDPGFVRAAVRTRSTQAQVPRTGRTGGGAKRSHRILHR